MKEEDQQLEDIYRNSTGIDQIMYDLGGDNFIRMTGCSDFFIDSNREDPWLRMTIPRNPGNVNRLEITLSSDDTYKLEFYKMTFSKHPEGRKTNETIYTDLKGTGIRDAFTDMTGLDVIMPEIERASILSNITDYLKKADPAPTEKADKKLKL